MRELELQYPTDPEAPTGAAAVIRTGRTEFLPTIPDELLVAASPDEKLLGILRDLGLRSVITAPLTARGRTFGAISLVIAESGRSYTSADVELLEDLAHRAATCDRQRPAVPWSEATIADTLQASLLPPALPDVPGLRRRRRVRRRRRRRGGRRRLLRRVRDRRRPLGGRDRRRLRQGRAAATLTGVARHTRARRGASRTTTRCTCSRASTWP